MTEAGEKNDIIKSQLDLLTDEMRIVLKLVNMSRELRPISLSCLSLFPVLAGVSLQC